jgi:phosphoglycerate dehydrogenase-like enzyme
MYAVAILDDYQGVALTSADWSPLDGLATVTVFRDHLDDEDALVRRLADFEVVCVMRERTPMTRSLLERLPKLRLIASTAGRNASIDLAAAAECGIEVRHTGYSPHGAMELTWALMLAALRAIPEETRSIREGGWQVRVGSDLEGKTIGIVGIGKIGSKIARVAKAFEMDVVAWSTNLTEERAREAGARLVSKDKLFECADVVTVHLVLGERSRGIVGASELARMKPSAWLVNTSRGPLVDETALIEALRSGRIAGAALDVFDREPLPSDHPFRTLPNVVATGHVGFVTHATYEIFYGDTVRNVRAWIAEKNISQGARSPS